MNTSLNLAEGVHYAENVDQLSVGDQVLLYSNRIDDELIVEITHDDNDELGGIIREGCDHPMVESGDHLHFRKNHIQRVVGENNSLDP
ncbi:MAG: hypothetical protein ABEJ65_05420 [bacterium]